MTGSAGAGGGATVRQVLAVCSLAAGAAPGILLVYSVLMVASGALPVVIAWLTKLVLDQLAGEPVSGTLVVVGVGLALAGLVGGVAPHAHRYLGAELDRRVEVRAQDRLFGAVERFVGLGRFEDPVFLDRLRLAQQSVHNLADQAVGGVRGVVTSAITIAGFVGSLFVLSPTLMVVVLGTGMLTLAAEIALSRRRARMLWRIGPVERREFFYAQLLSTVEAAKEVRLFGTGGFLRRRMMGERLTANAARRATDRREVAVQSVLAVLAATVAGGGLLWAIGDAQRGGLSVGDVTVFVAAVAGVQAALASLTNEVARTHQALLMFDHYLAVTRAAPDLPLAARPRPLPPLRHAIELRDVWFRYSEEHPWILRGVTLRIPHGQALALVGLNGAGKSTLAKLLCRFYDPTRGVILWDGVDIRQVDVTELRQRVGAVFQDYMAYDLTAGENIALGDLDALGDPGRISTAARRAGVHDRITELPRGYDTLLSRTFFSESDKDDPETGAMLSGGQWQRLALARAFLRDRHELLILDEPSSGLDPQAEAEIHRSLRRFRSGQTSLLISHRLGAVRTADLIVVLDDGQVAERGTHLALMTRGGLYAQLFRLQAAGYQESAPTGGDDVDTGPRPDRVGTTAGGSRPSGPNGGQGDGARHEHGTGLPGR
ncbi:multidrug ABC transporter permease [Actinophytocola xinjiangensis]|uniref:Multidrug ABC transporter permease n=1 Tax=Actinophytocola xinjiangensis TaxID=485602 RepID=A0A7Z0WRW7_9PSEU|nr:ABC transporter ATP-binding protein [Actinophytocola xinjiangensis]OLF14210.1 multidrug ABC transporter permease [Actinophytocola xinjiangensis]